MKDKDFLQIAEKYKNDNRIKQFKHDFADWNLLDRFGSIPRILFSTLGKKCLHSLYHHRLIKSANTCICTIHGGEWLCTDDSEDILDSICWLVRIHLVHVVRIKHDNQSNIKSRQGGIELKLTPLGWCIYKTWIPDSLLRGYHSHNILCSLGIMCHKALSNTKISSLSVKSYLHCLKRWCMPYKVYLYEKYYNNLIHLFLKECLTDKQRKEFWYRKIDKGTE